MTLGEKIGFLLRKKGFSPDDLAKKVDVSRQQVYKWINNVSIPRVPMVHKIAFALDAQPGDLLEDEAHDVKQALISTEEYIYELKERIKLLEKLLAQCEARKGTVLPPQKILLLCILEHQ